MTDQDSSWHIRFDYIKCIQSYNHPCFSTAGQDQLVGWKAKWHKSSWLLLLLLPSLQWPSPAGLIYRHRSLPAGRPWPSRLAKSKKKNRMQWRIYIYRLELVASSHTLVIWPVFYIKPWRAWWWPSLWPSPIILALVTSNNTFKINRTKTQHQFIIFFPPTGPEEKRYNPPFFFLQHLILLCVYVEYIRSSGRGANPQTPPIRFYDIDRRLWPSR